MNFVPRIWKKCPQSCLCGKDGHVIFVTLQELASKTKILPKVSEANYLQAKALVNQSITVFCTRTIKKISETSPLEAQGCKTLNFLRRESFGHLSVRTAQGGVGTRGHSLFLFFPLGRGMFTLWHCMLEVLFLFDFYRVSQSGTCLEFQRRLCIWVFRQHWKC